MLSRIILVLSALGVLVLVGCNSGGTTIVSPTPGPTCGPVGITSQLVYPAPGATGVSDSLSEIVIAVSSPLPINTYDLALTSGTTQSLTGNYLSQIPSNQLPAGSATTTISNPTYEAVNLINPLTAYFQNGATIQTAINNPNDLTNCTPQTIPGGSFTIQ